MLAVALASDSLSSAWSVQPADQPTISVCLLKIYAEKMFP